METEINSSIVKKYGMDAGAGIIGIASAGDFVMAPDGFNPSDVLEGCRSVIVLGASHPREALGSTEEYTTNRNAMLTNMTSIAKKVARRLTAGGFRAKAVSASGGKAINGKQHGHISLKHAAELAGIGIITRNYLLTNSAFGNLLWLSAVLTDAELTPDVKTKSDLCGNCNKCVEACPSGALNDPGAFGTKECAQFFKIVNRKFEIQCFLCRTVCPYLFGI